MSIIVDLDDFKDGNTSLDLLIKLKLEIPQFKVTLFAIPHYTSKIWLTAKTLQVGHGSLVKFDWIDFVPHGWDHHSNWECAHWSKKFMLEQMAEYLSIGFTTKGFKAPGWQISDGCYEALEQEGWWVADIFHNNMRRLLRYPQLKAYSLCADGNVLLQVPGVPAGAALVETDFISIHGHIGHLGGRNENELSLIYDKILAHKDEEFKFICEVMA